MSLESHAYFIAAAYAVTVVLLLVEVCLLARRSRAHGSLPKQGQDDEA